MVNILLYKGMVSKYRYRVNLKILYMVKGFNIFLFIKFFNMLFDLKLYVYWSEVFFY